MTDLTISAGPFTFVARLETAKALLTCAEHLAELGRLTLASRGAQPIGIE